MFGLGTQELLIILVLVMIIFGAGKLPQVGGALGKGLRNFKKGVNETDDDVEEGQVEEIVDENGDKKKTPDNVSKNKSCLMRTPVFIHLSPLLVLCIS